MQNNEDPEKKIQRLMGAASPTPKPARKKAPQKPSVPSNVVNFLAMGMATSWPAVM